MKSERGPSGPLFCWRVGRRPAACTSPLTHRTLMLPIIRPVSAGLRGGQRAVPLAGRPAGLVRQIRQDVRGAPRTEGRKMTQLDINWVRAQFPAFDTQALDGQAFFENAAGSYTCRQVLDRLTRFYTERKVQPYAPYDASRLGGEEMDEARARMAAMLGVDTDEVSFGPSTTQNTYVLAQAFRQWMKPGGGDRRHQPGSRGQHRPLASPGRRGDRGPRMEAEPGDRQSGSRRPGQAAGR